MKPRDQIAQSAESASSTLRNGMESTEVGDLLLEVESLRTRLSRLSEASRLVSESLDLSVVLQQVIDSARYLTAARYGALLTYEQSGAIQDFITSGLSPREIELLNTLPQGLGLLGYMNEIREPLRLSDISSHPSSVGFPDNHPPMKTFLGMPIRYRGEYVGNIYLTEKEGGVEFTSEDQETLVMFASQAGAAISNARRYLEEQQARADLEALVNISPVGVLVFDASTGDLVSANDETRRIVGKLDAPGRTLSQLLEVMPVRRADGSDIPIEELPTTKALKTGKTVLADEVVIHPPEGRQIRALVNARPVRGDDGNIVSVIATLQDITPLEEMKRQRMDFLSNLSHELRAPLTSIKGSAATMLSSPYPLHNAETRQLLRLIDEQSDHMRRLISDLVDVTHIEAGTLSVDPEPTDVETLLHDVTVANAFGGAKDSGIDVYVPLALPRVMADRRRITQVLDNLLANVAGYSPESSRIRIKASLEGVYVAVAVDSEDDGAGSPHQLERRARTAHGSLGMRSGRGDMGLAICEGIVEAHGGRLSIEGEGGRGNRFTVTIPAVLGTGRIDEQYSAESPPFIDPQGGTARVLVVGSDPETTRYIRSALSGAGFTEVVACGHDDADRLIEAQKPHVILLEPTLSWDDGFELLKRIGRNSDAPVIFVAGHGWEQQMGRAFEFGAFDYIAKPFTSTELVARVNLALRRRDASWKESYSPYLHGDLAIDYAGRAVTVSGEAIHLTATEYKLLTELSADAGRVLTHEQLLRRVWGPLYASDSRIVRTYIKELRHKLGDDAARPTYIFTEPGVGYRMPKPSNNQ